MALALSLYASGYSEQQTCDLVGVSKTTIHRWVTQNIDDGGFLDEYGLHQAANHIKSRMANRQMIMASNILESVSEEDMRKASLLQKTTAHCQLVDKSRLLSGDSTENISVIYGKRDKLEDKVSQKEQELRDLANELGVDWEGLD